MTSRFKARAVLIDLDGTLVDSLPDIACAVNSMQAELGLATLPVERIASYVGKGVDVLVHRALTGTMDDQAPPEAFHRGKTSFDRHYSEVNGNESRVYPGVQQALEELQTKGHAARVRDQQAARIHAAITGAHEFESGVRGDR